MKKSKPDKAVIGRTAGLSALSAMLAARVWKIELNDAEALLIGGILGAGYDGLAFFCKTELWPAIKAKWFSAAAGE